MSQSSFGIIIFFELIIFIVLGIAVAVMIGLLNKICNSLSQILKLHQTSVLPEKEEEKQTEEQTSNEHSEAVASSLISILSNPVTQEKSPFAESASEKIQQEGEEKAENLLPQEASLDTQANVSGVEQAEENLEVQQNESSVSVSTAEKPQTQSTEELTDVVKNNPKPAPSAFTKRMIGLRNWLIYGRVTGVAEGESAEKLLATTWLLRSGILVILFTTAFLLKLSIDRGILGPEGRVALSYLSGALLLFLGLNPKMRRKYWSLGQALTGIGLGMFYFSSYALTAMYHLAPPMVGGAIMCLVTITAGVLSDRLNALSVAMVAMIGGYATPLLLSTGSKNFPGLSGYLFLLGAGILWLANRRNWQQLTWIAMLFTYLIFGLAFGKFFAKEDFAIVQSSLVCFFVLFSTSVFLHNIRHKIPGGPLEILGLLGNSAFFFGLSIWAIGRTYPHEHILNAPLTLGLAFFYLMHAVFLARRNRECHRAFLLIFCAISGFYLALTFPVVLSGHWLGAAWALQALLLLWLGQKLDSELLRNCAWILYGVTILRLAIYEFCGYDHSSSFQVQAENGNFWLTVLSRFVQYIIPIGSLAIAGHLSLPFNKPRNKVNEVGNSSEESTRYSTAAALTSLSFLILFFFLRFEVGTDLQHIVKSGRLASINLVWLGTAVIALLLLRHGIPGIWRIFTGLLLGGTLVRLIYDFLQPRYWEYFPADAFWSHCFGMLANTAILTAGLFCICRLLPNSKNEVIYGRICRFVWPVMLFLHTTREWSLIIAEKLPGLKGGGVSVLWAIFAFAMVLRGLKKSTAWLRYCGLGLFAIVVVKVFMFDMEHLDAIYRVIAFLVFGVLLMGAAFIYLKFWHSKEEK